MPIKKPKAARLPSPFRDLMQSADDATRRRALVMNRELDRAGGFSWDAPRPGWADRVRLTRERLLIGGAAIGMGVLLVGAFFVAADTGFTPPPRIIYIEDWRLDRSSEQAVADRDEAMADLHRRYAAQEAAEAAQLNTPEAAAEASRAAAAADAAAAKARAARAAAEAREQAAARGATPR